jgi:hypothetical protein
MKTGTTSYTLALRAIEGLLEEARADVQLYELMLGRLSERAERSQKRRTTNVITDALNLDRERRNGNGNGNGDGPHEESPTLSLDTASPATITPTDKPISRGQAGNSKEAVLARRQRTFAFLQTLDTKTPRVPEENLRQLGISPLLNHGYIKKKGEGYIRTSKPYVVEQAHT